MSETEDEKKCWYREKSVKYEFYCDGDVGDERYALYHAAIMTFLSTDQSYFLW